MKKSKEGVVRSTALMGLLEDGNVSDAGTLDHAWKGAEAYHFLMLCQRQLYEGFVNKYPERKMLVPYPFSGIYQSHVDLERFILINTFI